MERTWIITDCTSSFSASDFLIGPRELGGSRGAFCRKRTLSGGRQQGVEIVEISNGIVALRVCPTRGMALIDGSFRPASTVGAGGEEDGPLHLGWHSPIREIVHPSFINLYDLGGRGAHYGFNEFVNRCGIEWSGAMGEDEVIDNMGDRSRVFLPLHGKVGWTPASRVELRVTDGVITLRGEVPEQNVFGVNYLLETELSLSEGSSRISVRDTLYNQGVLPGEYELLYHVNFGPPFLEEGSSYLGSFDRVIPRDTFAEAGIHEMEHFPGPAAGFTEQVFLFRARADEAGFAHQLLVNRRRAIAALLRFGADTLPYTILWKRCAAVQEGYVAGLNPCSDLPNTRRVEREGGRLAEIDGGAEVEFRLDIDLLSEQSEIDRAEAEIAAINSGVHGAPDGAEVGRAGDFSFLNRI